MKDKRWLMIAALVLLPMSVALYFLHYLLFRDTDHIFIYMIGDLAFLPAEVFLVVVVVERVLSRHEKRAMLEKMNMLIGMFFQELGVELLGELTEAIENKEELQPYLAIGHDWRVRDYRRALAVARTFGYRVDVARLDLARVRTTLREQRTLLMDLLANPNLLAHQRFTDLLWAVSHLRDELKARKSLDGLPASDLDHLAGDVRRVYAHLTTEWLLYCRHLQRAYPYIFSIIVRTHPLQRNPDPTVR